MTDKKAFYQAALNAFEEFLGEYDLSLIGWAQEEGYLVDADGNEIQSWNFEWEGLTFTMEFSDWSFYERYYDQIAAAFTFDEADGLYIAVTGWYDSWAGHEYEDTLVAKRVEHIDYSYTGV